MSSSRPTPATPHDDQAIATSAANEEPTCVAPEKTGNVKKLTRWVRKTVKKVAGKEDLAATAEEAYVKCVYEELATMEQTQRDIHTSVQRGDEREGALEELDEMAKHLRKIENVPEHIREMDDGKTWQAVATRVEGMLAHIDTLRADVRGGTYVIAVKDKELSRVEQTMLRLQNSIGTSVAMTDAAGELERLDAALTMALDVPDSVAALEAWAALEERAGHLRGTLDKLKTFFDKQSGPEAKAVADAKQAPSEPEAVEAPKVEARKAQNLPPPPRKRSGARGAQRDIRSFFK